MNDGNGTTIDCRLTSVLVAIVLCCSIVNLILFMAILFIAWMAPDVVPNAEQMIAMIGAPVSAYMLLRMKELNY